MRVDFSTTRYIAKEQTDRNSDSVQSSFDSRTHKRMQDTILLPHINSTRSKFTTNTFIYFDEHHRWLSTEYLPLFSKEGAKKIKEWQVRKDDTVRRDRNPYRLFDQCSHVQRDSCTPSVTRAFLRSFYTVESRSIDIPLFGKGQNSFE